MHITVSSNKNSGNGLHIDLVGHRAGFDGEAGNPLGYLQAPSCFNNSVPLGKRKKVRERDQNLPACFCQNISVPGHVSAAPVSWSEHKLSI